MASVTARPVNAISVVSIVHERNVSFSLIPRYLLTSQNPESFTWERIVAPEDIAITSKANIAAESSCVDVTGANSPAAVIIATVAEP